VKKKRECENWLKTFLDWTMPVSEAPESLLNWTGLFCISAVLKRKVEFSKEYLKTWRVLPQTYTIFVGPPGVVRKSTCAGYAQELFVAMNDDILETDPAYINLGPTSGSPQKMFDRLANTHDSSMVLVAGEFGNIVSTMPEETYDFFARLYDTDSASLRLEHSTRAHGDEVILNPSVCLLGCTTPGWIMNNSGYMQEGGFAARTVFVFEDKARQRHLFYKNIGPSVEVRDKIRKKLIKDLRRIGQLKGEFEPETEELAKKMDDWYLDYVDTPAERGAETFQARKHVHTLRTAMVLSVCERDDLIITNSHFDQAVKLINDVESKLSRGLSAMGRNPYSMLLHSIVEYIEREGKPSEGQTVAYFLPDAPSAEIYSTLQVLKDSQQIEGIGDNPRCLRIKKK